jgi:hypothetical protein
MPTPRQGLTSAAVNGKIYAIGGGNATGFLTTNEEYTPEPASFLTLPLKVTCKDSVPGKSLPCTPYTAKISAVLDHSVPTIYNCDFSNETDDPTDDCDGVVLAFNAEEGRKEFGENCPPPGYKKDAKGTPFFKNKEINYVGVGCPPVDTQIFPPRRYLNYDGHSGYDFKYGKGTPILAAADGTLEVPASDPINNPPGSDPKTSFNTLRIIHPNGYETWYLHAREGSECIAFIGRPCGKNSPSRPQPGDTVQVKAGGIIGRVGNTGTDCDKRNVEGCFHLHFEVRIGDTQVVDPFGCAATVQAIDPLACVSKLWKD